MRALFVLVLPFLWSTVYAGVDCPDSLDFHKRVLAGDRKVHLCEAYQDKVILVVNTASRCAYTDQYEGLENIYAKYRNQGFVVLGFPSNDFGTQEPGSEEQIKEFCRLTYSVAFPMFEKTRARQGVADPFFDSMAQLAGEYPRWNFHKYLIGRNGQMLGSFASRIDPEDPLLVDAVEASLMGIPGKRPE